MGSRMDHPALDPRKKAASPDIPQIKEAGALVAVFHAATASPENETPGIRKDGAIRWVPDVFGKLLVCLLRVRGWRNGDRARVRISPGCSSRDSSERRSVEHRTWALQSFRSRNVCNPAVASLRNRR